MSYYMCPTCHKVYDGHFLKSDEFFGLRCPDVNCYSLSEELFEIDELMVIPIRKLNELGYETKYCCSGHSWDYTEVGGYIMFSLEDSPMVPTVPKGWYFDSNCIRFAVKKGTTEAEKRIVINNAINELVKWCYTLPEAEYDEE